MIHSLSEIDTDARTAVCSHCGPVGIKSNGYATAGGVKRWKCREAARPFKGQHSGSAQWRARRRSRKGLRCQDPDCTATIVHPDQLDVHHIDGDHANNSPENLRTLCANCHRLTHALERQEAPAGCPTGPPVLLG